MTESHLRRALSFARRAAAPATGPAGTGRQSRSILAAVVSGAMALTSLAPAAQAQSPRLAAPQDGPSLRSGGLAAPDSLRATMSPTLRAPQTDARTVDYIVAVVDQEPITNSEIQQRVSRVLQEGAPDGGALPSREALRQQVLDALIDERAQLALARNLGVRASEAEIDQAIANIAEQNQISPVELRRRLRTDNIDYARFRQNIRERMLLERLRDREVPQRIRIAESEVDNLIKEQLGSPTIERELSLAQILVAVPEGASEALVRSKRELADKVLAQARAGADFFKLAQDVSDDVETRAKGGEMGWRPVSRVPDLFVNATTALKPGEVAAQVLRSPAGFHIVRLIDRRDALAGYAVTQSRARHILIRPPSAAAASSARAQLADIRQKITTGQASFAQMARQYSQDGTATRGGDLGWSTVGMFVPEFQKALDGLQPGELSEPVSTRFGLHLIQLMERRQAPVDPRQLRENARNMLREQRFDAAYQEWAREVRAQTYIEMREPPQ